MSNVIIRKALEKLSKEQLERHALSGNPAMSTVAKELLEGLTEAVAEAIKEEPVADDKKDEEVPTAEAEKVEEEVVEAPAKVTRKRAPRKKANSAE